MSIKNLFVPLALSAVVTLGALPLSAASQSQQPPARGGAQPAQKPQTPSQPAPQQPAAQQPAAKTRTVEGELVSVDAKAHTITFKDAAGKTMTAQVQARAEKDAAQLKAGDRVRLTVQENAKGGPQVVTAIQRAPAPAPRS